MFNKKFLPYFVCGVIGIIISAAYIFAIDPEENFFILDFSLSPIPFLFFLLYISITSILVWAFRNLRRGILGGLFLLGIMLLQLFQYRNLLYPILLLLILILIEVLFFKKNT